MAEVQRIGVIGAGTMGAGIAQVSCLGGFETFLHDPVPSALEHGVSTLHEAVARGADRGHWPEADADAAKDRLVRAPVLEDLSGCDLIIEAAPEDLGLKRDLFAKLAGLCSGDTVLATNTSSLSVTAIGAGIERAERVVGMHFFNPPALMRLVEVVAGDASGQDALETTTAVALRMGRTPIRAADEIGFVGNRCARPYSLEALRLLGSRIATHEQIDRICRIGGGFRMGPFELTDLVGVDVNLEVAKSFWEQSFHEPRWQPHPIQSKMVAAGRLGRKAGRGYYDYAGGPHRPDDPSGPGDPPVGDGPPLHAGPAPDEPTTQRLGGSNLLAVSLERGSLGALCPGEDAVGYVALPDLESARLVELTRGATTSGRSADAAESHFRGLGKQVEWVADAPGLVLGRILAQLANEAHFALAAEIATADDIDIAMRLGFNYPRGPFAWTDAIGAERLVGILDALHAELGEERYRVSPALRSAATAD